MTSGVPRQVGGIDQQAHEDTATPDSAQAAASPLEQALAEIAERQRVLDGEAGLPHPDLPRATTQRRDGLEQQLRSINARIEALRPCGIASAVETLSEDVRTLGAKVDRVMDSGFLTTLEQRIATMADALQSRHQVGDEAHDLGALVQKLTEKLEQQLTRTDDGAGAAIEGHVAKLLEKLEASDVRTHDSIEAVQGTLRYVVDRLATIDAGTHGDHVAGPPKTAATASPAAAAAAAPPASRVLSTPPAAETSEPSRAAAAAPVAAGTSSNPAPATDRRPIDPDLPPDHPLEPGAARGRGHSPADRIAASEAALGPSRPPVIPDPGGKSDFIAAARRAAQAAGGAAGGRDDRGASPRVRPDDEPEGEVGNHIRTLLVGASIVLIVLGSLQLLTGVFSGSNPSAPPDQSAQVAPSSPVTARMEPEAAPEMPLPASQSGQQSPRPPAAVPFAPHSTSALLTGEPLPQPVSATTTPPRSPETPSEPLTTGSAGVPNPAAAITPTPPRAPHQAAARPSGAEKLPATIGSSSLRAAAVKGEPAAEFEIAVRFADGRGVPQDLAAAAQWLERAAKQGLPPAQFRLGGLYEKGIGVRKDLDRARRLYLAAAQAGNAKAMHNLAVLHAEGVDGKPDYQAAAKWFRRAADHGIADSQYNLGVLYARGIGTEANLAEAFKWFSLAARQGDRDSAKKRDDIGARLDHATAAAARAAVEAWTAEPQPESATQVKTPPGGWDGGPAPTTAKRRAGSDAKAPRVTQ